MIYVARYLDLWIISDIYIHIYHDISYIYIQSYISSSYRSCIYEIGTRAGLEWGFSVEKGWAQRTRHVWVFIAFWPLVKKSRCCRCYLIHTTIPWEHQLLTSSYEEVTMFPGWSWRVWFWAEVPELNSPICIVRKSRSLHGMFGDKRERSPWVPMDD